MRQSNSGTTIGAESGKAGVDDRLTGSYNDLVRRRIAADPVFRDGLRQEALNAIHDGEVDVGMSMLRDYFGETGPIDNVGPEPKPQEAA
jgi:hypothetical protein